MDFEQGSLKFCCWKLSTIEIPKNKVKSTYLCSAQRFVSSIVFHFYILSIVCAKCFFYPKYEWNSIKTDDPPNRPFFWEKSFNL